MSTYYVDSALGSDANAGTSPGSGGAWLTIGHALATIVGGDLVHVKASAVYAIATGLAATAGTYNQITRLVGYTTTPGDGGRATIRATAAIVGLTISSVYNFSLENFVLDGNALTGTQGVVITSATDSGSQAVNCRIQDWSAEGFATSAPNGSKLLGGEVTGCGGSFGAVAGGSGARNFLVEGVAVHGNTSQSGILLSGTYSHVAHCRVYSNAGHGIWNNGYNNTIGGNTIDGNTGHGILLDSYYITGPILNNILTRNGSYGLSISNLGGTVADPAVDYNWFGTGALVNTSGMRSGIAAGAHDLSGDPQYANAAAGDFTPTNAAVQAGFP